MIVRADLPLGLQVAMAVHAAGESLQRPHSPGTNVVVLSANAQTLDGLAVRLAAAGVPCKSVVDPDVGCGAEILAIGLAPGPKDALRRYVSSLPLLR